MLKLKVCDIEAFRDAARELDKGSGEFLKHVEASDAERLQLHIETIVRIAQLFGRAEINIRG
jgi:hypothetical protein